MRDPITTVDLSKKCAECGDPGAVESGICLGCTAKAMRRLPMKSEIGRAVQKRFADAKGAKP